MSRRIKWHLSIQDLEELFQSTFGPHDDFSVEWVDFDEQLGSVEIEILDEVTNTEDDASYTGVRIA